MTAPEPQTFADSLASDQAAEDAVHAAWQLGDYVGQCPRCGRHRLCACPNGMHRCEKCNFSPELDGFAPVDA
jgi:ribosomal protein L37AE/L43A